MQKDIPLYQMARLVIEKTEILGGSKQLLELLPEELKNRRVNCSSALDLFVQIGTLAQAAIDRFALLLNEPNYREDEGGAAAVATFLYSDARIHNTMFRARKTEALFLIALLCGVGRVTGLHLDIEIL